MSFAILLQAIDLFDSYSPGELIETIAPEAEAARTFLEALVHGLKLDPADVLPGSSWYGYISAIEGRTTDNGRPSKYRELRLQLQNGVLHSPASIARRYAADLASRYCCRKALCHFAHYHHFPGCGDGTIKLRGQDLAPAWFGWRWKFPVIAILADKVNRVVAVKESPPAGDQRFASKAAFQVWP